MRRFLAIPVALLMVGCAEDPVLTPSVPTTITRVGNEVGTPGWLLTEGLSVVVHVAISGCFSGPVADWVLPGTWRTTWGSTAS